MYKNTYKYSILTTLKVFLITLFYILHITLLDFYY